MCADNPCGILWKKLSFPCHVLYFIILYGVRVSVKVLDAHHQKLPLIQKGLQILVEVPVEMVDTEENQLALAKYEVRTDER